MIIFAFILANTVAKSQDIQLFDSLYKARTVFLNGEKVMWRNSKIKLKHFKLELLKYQDSRMEYRRFKRNDNHALIWFGAALGGIILSRPFEGRDIGVAGLVFGIGGWIPFALHKRKSRQNLNRAIWFYNRDVLMEQIRRSK